MEREIPFEATVKVSPFIKPTIETILESTVTAATVIVADLSTGDSYSNKVLCGSISNTMESVKSRLTFSIWCQGTNIDTSDVGESFALVLEVINEDPEFHTNTK